MEYFRQRFEARIVVQLAWSPLMGAPVTSAMRVRFADRCPREDFPVIGWDETEVGSAIYYLPVDLLNVYSFS